MLLLRKPEAHRIGPVLGKTLVVIRATLRVCMAFYMHGTCSMNSDEVGGLVKGLGRRWPDVCFVKIE
jgi:hypothetical protein